MILRSLVGVGMGVGKARVDGRWRITLPAGARGNLKPGDEVVVEEHGDVIVIRKAMDPLKVFHEVVLRVEDRELALKDASEAKHIYGALKE